MKKTITLILSVFILISYNKQEKINIENNNILSDKNTLNYHKTEKITKQNFKKNIKDDNVKINDKNGIQVETSHLSSGYCNGGKLSINGKKIFEHEKYCILKYDFKDNNINLSICYGDGGGSGECVFIDMIYNTFNNSWTFLDTGGYYSPESIDKYKLNINEKSLLDFKKYFKKNYDIEI